MTAIASLTFWPTKRLLTALGMTLQRREQTFGNVELDVRNRAIRFNPMQAGPADPRLSE